MQENKGISDIASSEGDLSDFTKICRAICNNRLISKEKLFKIIMNEIKSKSEGSIERKLSIMQKLNLIDIVNQKYALNSNGKILIEISNEPFVFSEKIEKAFYFIILFMSDARIQLATLLQSINEQNGDDKKNNILRYFKTDIAQMIWNKQIVQKNIHDLEKSNKIPSMFNNKFSCMNKWLQIIDLVESKQNGLHVNLPKKMINSLTDSKNVEKIFEETATKYYPEAVKFNLKKHYQKLSELFIEGHEKFCTSTVGISDADAVGKYVCLQLLKSGIILEENHFFKLTGELKQDNIIRSVMIGRDGKPKNFSVN